MGMIKRNMAIEVGMSPCYVFFTLMFMMEIGMGVDVVVLYLCMERADIGIAMGAGSDIAIEAGDITLMRNGLRAVESAILLARRTMTTMKQNLFWAFIIRWWTFRVRPAFCTPSGA